MIFTDLELQDIKRCMDLFYRSVALPKTYAMKMTFHIELRAMTSTFLSYTPQMKVRSPKWLNNLL